MKTLGIISFGWNKKSEKDIKQKKANLFELSHKLIILDQFSYPQFFKSQPQSNVAMVVVQKIKIKKEIQRKLSLKKKIPKNNIKGILNKII